MQHLTDISSISVYQLVHYVNDTYGTNIQHNQVMIRQMPDLLKCAGFGPCAQIVELCSTNGHWGEITTYKLTPQQCVVVAAKICAEYLIQVVKKLHVLLAQSQHVDDITIQHRTLAAMITHVNQEYGTKIRHRDVMKRHVPKLLATEGFGEAEPTVQAMQIGSGAKRNVDTYIFSKFQLTVIAAKICNPYLMLIVQTLHLLELEAGVTTTQSELQQAITEWVNYYEHGMRKPGVSVFITGMNTALFYYKPDHYVVIPSFGKPPVWDNVTLGKD